MFVALRCHLAVCGLAMRSVDGGHVGLRRMRDVDGCRRRACLDDAPFALSKAQIVQQRIDECALDVRVIGQILGGAEGGRWIASLAPAMCQIVPDGIKPGPAHVRIAGEIKTSRRTGYCREWRGSQERVCNARRARAIGDALRISSGRERPNTRRYAVAPFRECAWRVATCEIRKFRRAVGAPIRVARLSPQLLAEALQSGDHLRQVAHRVPRARASRCHMCASHSAMRACRASTVRSSDFTCALLWIACRLSLETSASRPAMARFRFAIIWSRPARASSRAAMSLRDRFMGQSRRARNVSTSSRNASRCARVASRSDAAFPSTAILVSAPADGLRKCSQPLRALAELREAGRRAADARP